ncbi:DNA-directed DNA polymerase II small subunit [Candidatus Woesearchaeota archaeon]|nr:DNA-directed DNA polymerase II small subunit [Candidatus Woesearchaeota archaeon]
MDSTKKKIIRILIEKGLLVSEDLIEKLDQTENLQGFLDRLESKKDRNEDLLLLCEENLGLVRGEDAPPNWKEFEESRANFEKNSKDKKYERFVEHFQNNCSQSQNRDQPKDGPIQKENTEISKNLETSPCDILFSYEEKQGKKTVKDFVSYFNHRFQSLSGLLTQRSELQGLTSISRIAAKKDRENVSMIGMIRDISTTKNENLMVTVEDQTGYINVLISKNKPELYHRAADLVEDEVIGIQGVSGNNVVFANNVVWPEVPLNKEFKKYPEETYAAFLSDIHVGSKLFLKDSFMKFIKWLNGGVGSDKQKEVASKIKYLFVAGDLVDGVGIYPGQEEELEIPDIYKQYEECARLLDQVPKHITIILSPGNHDAMRLAEPQPRLYKDLSEAIWKLKNVIIVSNPAIVNVLRTEDFPGFDVLLYHGYSFDHYISNVDSIRNNGGYDRADLIMKFLLTRRHLAPTHTSTSYIPDSSCDPLVIQSIPDFFVTGHIHKTSVSNYRNITMICGSTWQAKTDFQEKVGHHPEPARVPLVNFNTREVKILKF